MTTVRAKSILIRLVRNEKGQALILVLIFMLVGALVLTPLLFFMSTGAKTGQAFQQKTAELYAADAGVQDGMWQVKYSNIKSFNTPVVYSPYDYNDNWSYPLSNQVNAYNVDVTIANVWVPMNIQPPPSPNVAAAIIQSGKLVVTGSAVGTATYQIKITYYKGADDPPLQIRTLGVWLPPGFTYVAGSSNLEQKQSEPYYPLSISNKPWDGGQAVIWTFKSGALFAGSDSPGTDPFPGVNVADVPITSTITFNFTSQQPGSTPDAISWVTTAGVNDIPFSWNSDTRVFHIKSVAGSTQVDTYIVKNELRQVKSAIAGDYYATGNSNLSAPPGSHIRTIWHDPSSATVTAANIPADADVSAAYLYWSGWKSDNSVTSIFNDQCGNLGNWMRGSDWDENGGYFTSHHSSGLDANRSLTLKKQIDLSSYGPGSVIVSWDQWVTYNYQSPPGPNDGLDFSISSDGGVTWSGNIQVFRNNIGGSQVNPNKYSYTVPTQYLTAGFEIRLYLVGFSGPGQYLNLDNIEVKGMQGDNSVIFKIDDGSGAKQVYFDANGQPQQGNQELTASKIQVVENFANVTNPAGFSYSSFRDVTELVKKYSKAPTAPATNWPGYGTYWVGGVSADSGQAAGQYAEWAYACWSLVIIYTSPETQGHQLYLYDKFINSGQNIQNGVDVDFDGDGQPGGTLSGFIVPQPVQGEVNAGKITTFVGEGDVWYGGDYVALNGTKLWDGITCNDNSKSNPDNVFNSTSLGLNTNDGVDVDTLGIDPTNGKYITWNSGLLNPGDTSAHIDMVTHTDVWNLIYIIISFRSSTSTGGSIMYLIKNSK